MLGINAAQAVVPIQVNFKKKGESDQARRCCEIYKSSVACSFSERFDLHERVVLRGAEGRGPVARRLTRPCEALLGRLYAVPQMHEGWPCLKCTNAARSIVLVACP